MKSYLSLIPISARVHKRQNRMTLLCIVLAVFLVTAIFSMADAGNRMEKNHSILSHGNWHVRLENVSEEDGEFIGFRSDVAAVSRYDVVNLDMDEDYYIGGIKTALCGIDEDFVTDIMPYFTEGTKLTGDSDIILTVNAKELLGVDMGDSITLNTPDGTRNFTVSGFRSDDSRYVTSNGGEVSALLVKDDQIGSFMSTKAFREICGINAPEYYIQFRGGASAVRKALADISEQYGLSSENIRQNAMVMAAMGLSDNQYMQTFYGAAAVLFVLILAAGVLMISGSMNSNIAQRSQFFGMLRCIGASRKQVIRFVRLEAMNWCKTAIPIGIVLGTVVSWGLCAVLRYLVGGEVSDIQIFGVSPIGIVSGIVVGLLTVLLAAQAPAKRAAKVSPVAAVQGSAENTKNIRRAANTGLVKIETALGAHHAAAEKKNLLLMTGSFALSIILFLSFSVLVELMGYLLPQKSYASDLEITSKDLSNSVDSALLDEISRLPGVKQTVGRMYVYDVPARFGREMTQSRVSIISYGEVQLGWLTKDKDLRKGSDIERVYGDSGYVLTIYDTEVPLETGDKIQIGTAELEIAGMLKYSPFSNDGRTKGEVIVICSEETFTRLTGISDYALIEAQLTKDAPESTVSAVRRMADGKYNFRDRRDEADQSLYWAFMLFVYGFLAIIAMITVLNIVNSVSMSVSARMRQYGAMRAIGMSTRQITKMIAAEAATYAVSGCVVGCGVGLPLHKLLYDYLITSHFDYFTWSIPIVPITVILLFVAFASAAAVYAPSKRIRSMSIVGTIHAE